MRSGIRTRAESMTSPSCSFLLFHFPNSGFNSCSPKKQLLGYCIGKGGPVEAMWGTAGSCDELGGVAVVLHVLSPSLAPPTHYLAWPEAPLNTQSVAGAFFWGVQHCTI